MQLILAVLFVLISAISSYSADWYVATDGNDSTGDGSIGSPFATIAKAVDQYGSLAAGDTVYVRGGTYLMNRVSTTKDGTAESPITLRNYPSESVVLDFSLQPSNSWSVYSGNVYQITVPTPYPGDTNTASVYNVVLDGDPKYIRRSTLVEVDAPYEFYFDTSADTLYVYPADSADPTGKQHYFIGDYQYHYGLYLNLASHWVIDGFTIYGAEGHAISIDGDNVTIQNCTMKYNLKNAIYYWSSLGAGIHHDTATVDNVTSEWNMMRNWPRCGPDYSAGGWGQGISFTNVDTVSVTNSTVLEGGGEGIGFVKVNGGTIEDNVSYNNWSVGLYVDQSQNAIVRRNIVYVSDDHVNTSDIDESRTGGTELSCEQRLRQNGITVGDEYYTDTTSATSDNIKIYNNLIVGVSTGFNYITENVTTPRMKDILFANNTIVLPNATGSNGDYIGFNVRDYAASSGNSFSSNIIYATYATSYLIYAGYAGAIPTGVTFGNNLWYHPNNTTPFHWDGNNDWSYSDWTTTYTSQGIGSAYGNPNFTTYSTNYASGDYSLASDSPAIEIGANLSATFTTDILSNIRSLPYDAGAYEYEASSYMSVTISNSGTPTTISNSGTAWMVQ